MVRYDYFQSTRNVTAKALNSAGDFEDVADGSIHPSVLRRYTFEAPENGCGEVKSPGCNVERIIRKDADGKETVHQIEPREGAEGQPSQSGGSLAFKASWKKGGKSLELQSTRKFKTPEGERSMTNKDRWELSEDGQTLNVKRIIDMPMGMEEVKLIFTRQ